jgi:uncharacterized protein (TIGR03083 family)
VKSIENLAAVWSSIEALCGGLSEEEWKRPTGCPGWSVQDNVSHIIDYESRALGRPGPEHQVGDADHVKNPLGASNEVGIDYRRGRSGAEVLAEFSAVTADRLAQLRALSEQDMSREIDLPVGKGTVADMLTLRVMDRWSHEQDIRRAVGRPGHADGPVADETVNYFCRFVPLVVARRAGAADGDSVVFEIGAAPPLVVSVDGGRGSVVGDVPASPTLALRMTAPVFAALVGGRADVGIDDVDVTGDRALAQRVVAGLAFLP